MRLAALCSGGKDSVYSMLVMEEMGHEVTHLLTVEPEAVDSMMFHTPNIGLAAEVADCMGKRFLSQPDRGDGLGALSKLVDRAAGEGIEGIVTGAIQSDYQHTRMDRICHEAGLRCFSPLWRKDQSMLLQDVVESGIHAIVVATAAEGLGAEFLGRQIDRDFLSRMEDLHQRYGINVCGEGGEYETLVTDSPLHIRKMVVTEFKVESSGSSSLMKVTKLEKRKKL